MSRIVVLGTGIVGTAAAWDLVRRGHDVVVADADATAAERTGEELGVDWSVADASSEASVRPLINGAVVVVSAVPYRFGLGVARLALEAGCHYLDFGGNPTVVAAQLDLDQAARAAGISIIPDCGLAPGLANVLAAGAVAELGPGPVEFVGIRVGAIPTEPVGALGYQLTFSPAGLINEYAEPCEVLRDGRYATVEPLTEIEHVEWPGWGPLEAFHTAGGSSSLPRRWEGIVRDLDYKTLRYPGHAAIIRALAELGLFSEDATVIDGSGVSPRRVLLHALEQHLPRQNDDLVLLRVWAAAQRGGETMTAGYQLEDRHDGRFSALARTTAFPATALAHLLATGGPAEPGAGAMESAVEAAVLIPELETRGIAVTPWPAA